MFHKISKLFRNSDERFEKKQCAILVSYFLSIHCFLSFSFCHCCRYRIFFLAIETIRDYLESSYIGLSVYCICVEVDVVCFVILYYKITQPPIRWRVGDCIVDLVDYLLLFTFWLENCTTIDHKPDSRVMESETRYDFDSLIPVLIFYLKSYTSCFIWWWPN